jgi:hypothetical protein
MSNLFAVARAEELMHELVLSLGLDRPHALLAESAHDREYTQVRVGDPAIELMLDRGTRLQLRDHGAGAADTSLAVDSKLLLSIVCFSSVAQEMLCAKGHQSVVA